MFHFYPTARWSILYAACIWATIPAIAQAQIIPDNTLGVERSEITYVDVGGGAIADIIGGGATRGRNVFHSFRQFNVNNGQTVFFFAPTGIQTVFARVTDGPSRLFGTLGTINLDNRPTNLFLLNPNGIIFGPNAQLFVTGSFLGTTASYIQFPEGNFSATQLSGPPLLTVSAPIGLGFESTPGAIEVQSARLLTLKDLTLVGGDISIANSRLRSSNNKIELAAIGGGTIGLSSSDAGIGLTLPSNSLRRDIALQNRTRLDNGTTGEGRIMITARNLTVSNSQIVAGISEKGTIDTQAKDIVIDVSDRTVFQENSQVSNSVVNSDGNGGNILIKTGSLQALSGSEIISSHNANGNSGNIIISASGDVTFQGESPTASNSTVPDVTSAVTSVRKGGRGNSGNLEISAKTLQVLDGASLDTSSDGIGNSGTVKLNIQDSTKVDGQSKNLTLSSIIRNNLGFNAQGRGGDVLIQTGSLTLSNGAEIDSTLYGQGVGGNIDINARGAVVVEGNAPFNIPGLLSVSSINSRIGSNESGQGGSIRINARSLRVSRGATIDSGVFGTGQGGNITISTQESTTVEGEGISYVLPSGDLRSSISDISSKLVRYSDQSAQSQSTTSQAGSIQITAGDVQVLNGGSISTLNAGTGNGGNIEIKARDRIIVSGTAKDGTQSDISSSTLAVTAEVAILGNITVQGVGQSGNIRLITNRLDLQGGFVSAFSSSPTGESGNIDIQVQDLFLDRARIRTDSTSGNGGNLAITANNLLLLRRDSNITASAGTRNLGGNGGNIKIATTNLVAVPRENSDITANAFTGNGGNISLTTTGLLGIKPQPRLTPFSDITASSAQGVQGTISLTQPDLRPEQGLTELPNDLTDASNQIAPTCPRPGTTTPQGRFTATGRGSLPPTPLDGPSTSLTLPPLARIEKNGKDAIAAPTKRNAIALARIATSCALKSP